MPLKQVDLAFEIIASSLKQLKTTEPSSIVQSLEQYHNYVDYTWLRETKIRKLWNHHDLESDRTNNNNEGFNNFLQHFIAVQHPNIYHFIDDMKAVETKVSILYFNIKYNGGKGSKTKSITATRDHSIAKLKIQLQSSAISIQYYMIQTAKLYSYCNDKEKDLPVSDSLFLVDNVVNTITPVVSVCSLLINVFDKC